MKSGTTATTEWRGWLRLLKSGKLCREWQSFVTFYADTGDIPPGYKLKRINSRLVYSLDNCHWLKVKSDTQKDTWCHVLPLRYITGQRGDKK